MNPKSPLLMKAMGVSPAKNMNKGYGPAKTSSPAKQRSGGISRNDEEARGVEDETRNIRGRGEMLPREDKARSMKKELKRIKKKKPSVIEPEPIKKAKAKKTEEQNKVEKKQLTPKQKALQKLREAQGDNEVANIEKETSKVKKNSTKKRKQSKRKDSQAERRTEKTKKLEERIQRRKARRSPAKQTAKQKANLPKEIVDAIAAKSPAKQSKRTTRLKNKEAKETNKIIRGEKTSARKVNRLNDRLEVSKAKDKVKAVRKSQRAQKLKDKAAVLNNKAQG